ncbi:AbgT family transporter [Segatella salivae]|nr:AbgT family transporter [Segatella salivae]
MIILLSWLLSAALPDLSVHSLLSSEGIRWFFGQFSSNIATPLTAWLIVAVIAYGCLSSCGILELKHPLDFRQRVAIRFVVFEIVVFVAIILLLTLMPHAVLLSIDGDICSGSLANSIIPYLSLVVCVASITYAYLSGRCNTKAELFDMLCEGNRQLSPLFIIYVLLTQLVYSVLYVLSAS